MSFDRGLKAPFPWFGGKSRAAHLIWDRFGPVPNYVEPFAGSMAVLLNRPTAPKLETVNDLDCYLANFWRSVKLDPVETAKWADWPVNEADLLARNAWLIDHEEFRQAMKSQPDYHHPQIAGWWVWGISEWIGGGWTQQRAAMKLPILSGGQAINRKLELGQDRGEWIRQWFKSLSTRLRDVRVTCGSWERVLTPAVTIGNGLTGVLLDPPYDSDEHAVRYAAHSNVSGAVRDWAITHGGDPLLRIALCGYEGEHAMPATWEVVPWKAQGGYGNQGQGRGRENARRERVWFSQHCLRPERRLF